jgi:hypothetical protein
VTTTNADGSTTTKNLDGTSIVTMADGTSIINLSDGTSSSSLDNGHSTRTNNPDGTYTETIVSGGSIYVEIIRPSSNGGVIGLKQQTIYSTCNDYKGYCGNVLKQLEQSGTNGKTSITTCQFNGPLGGEGILMCVQKINLPPTNNLTQPIPTQQPPNPCPVSFDTSQIKSNGKIAFVALISPPAGGPTHCETIKPPKCPILKLGPNAETSGVSLDSIRMLQNILDSAGLSDATITRTTSSPADQARIMYNQLEAGTISTYTAYGQQVIDVYNREKQAGLPPSQIEADMLAKINALGPYNVSHHIGDPSKLNVVDIDPKSIANKTAFINAVNAATDAGLISKFLQPPHDPAYHIEIPQPIPAGKLKTLACHKV